MQLNMLHTVETTMKLSNLENQIIAILAPKPGVDMDAITNLGPEIARHLNALIDLCDSIPNSANLKDQVTELKSLFSTYVPMNDNMLEKTSVAEGVVYRLDSEDPMNKSEILILGGAGRYTMAGLRTKAARESAQLADDLSTKHADYHGAAHAVKQVANTINTMVAALNELEKMKITDSHVMEQQLQQQAQASVGKLESRLKQAAKGGNKLSYGAIDEIMQKVCKEDDVAPNDLHNMFVASHAGWTPDQWVKNSPDVIDSSIHESTILDQIIRDSYVLEMYETMRVGLGDKAWVAITKRLIAEGYDSQMVENIVNRAIITSQINK